MLPKIKIPWLKGKKTYIVAAALVLTGFGNALDAEGTIDLMTFALELWANKEIILIGIGFAAVRDGLNTTVRAAVEKPANGDADA